MKPKNYKIAVFLNGKEIARHNFEWDGRVNSILFDEQYKSAISRYVVLRDPLYENGYVVTNFTIPYVTMVKKNVIDGMEYAENKINLHRVPEKWDISLLSDILPQYYSDVQLDIGIHHTELPEEAEGFVMYQPGILLSTSILCNETATRFIGSPIYKFKSALEAKSFSSAKDLLKFLKAQKDVLSNYIWKYGFCLTPCFSTKMALEDYQMSLTPKKMRTEQAAWQEISKLLELLDNAYTMSPKCFPCTETPEQEAIARMQDMNMAGYVVTRYQKNRGLFMSEFNGMLYNLSEEAEKALAYAKKNGNVKHPYHVIVSRPYYTILYVSEDKENWEYERYNKRYGYLIAYVYNEDHEEYSEHGTVTLTPANGGLIRLG